MRACEAGKEDGIVGSCLLPQSFLISSRSRKCRLLASQAWQWRCVSGAAAGSACGFPFICRTSLINAPSETLAPSGVPLLMVSVTSLLVPPKLGLLPPCSLRVLVPFSVTKATVLSTCFTVVDIIFFLVWDFHFSPSWSNRDFSHLCQKFSIRQSKNIESLKWSLVEAYLACTKKTAHELGILEANVE